MIIHEKATLWPRLWYALRIRYVFTLFHPNEFMFHFSLSQCSILGTWMLYVFAFDIQQFVTVTHYDHMTCRSWDNFKKASGGGHLPSQDIKSWRHCFLIQHVHKTYIGNASSGGNEMYNTFSFSKLENTANFFEIRFDTYYLTRDGRWRLRPLPTCW